MKALQYITVGWLACLGWSAAQDYAAWEKELLALTELTEPPQTYEAKGFEGADRLKPLFYDGVPYEGEPTRVFAWLGLPADVSEPVPAMVLVHGGGGTAFRDWVVEWTQRGYAAISIAVEGQTDAVVPNAPRGSRWQSHAWAGPKREGIYADTGKPIQDQWMYHAVAGCIRANSLLRSMPQVNAEQIGLMGMSWGGVLTSTVIGVDDRFAFAVPVYGCGDMHNSPNHWGLALERNPAYEKFWDPVQRMDRVQMPVLWLSFPKESHFHLPCLATTYEAAPGPRMISLIPGMGHGSRAAWVPPDSYAFADSIVKQGRPWCLQVDLKEEGGKVEVTFDSTKPLQEALLISTKDGGFTGDRKWEQTSAEMEQADGKWIIRAQLPAGTTAWIVNAKSGDLTVSSDFQETAQSP